MLISFPVKIYALYIYSCFIVLVLCHAHHVLIVWLGYRIHLVRVRIRSVSCLKIPTFVLLQPWQYNHILCTLNMLLSDFRICSSSR